MPKGGAGSGDSPISSPFREHIVGNADVISGLAFAPDCRTLYFTAADLAADGSFATAVWQVDAHDGATVAHWQVPQGVGGDVSADGARYVYVNLLDDAAELRVLNFSDGTSESLGSVPNVTSLGAPSFAPDGTRLAFSGRTAQGFNLFLRGVDGTLTQLTDDDAFNYAPRWLDAEHLLFVRGHHGHLQAHILTLATAAMEVLTDAPYALIDATPLDAERLAFLMRRAGV